MAKHIIIEHNDKKYKLEYNRKTVVMLEDMGFNIEETKSNNKPLKTMSMLFDGAFMMHHPDIDEETKDEIFDSIPNMSEFIAKLAELYVEPIKAMGNSKGNDAKNSKWVTSWK